MPTSYYAGLPQGELNLVVFQNEDQLVGVLKAANISVQGKNVLHPAGHHACCEACDAEITTKNLGNVMPGSTLFFCDNPFCLSSYIAEHAPSEPATSSE